jgi:hypothetical protein
MKHIIKWVSEARPDKDIGPAMTHYLVKGGMIRATNGKITASHPWPDAEDEFLVSGYEFEKILARMQDDSPTITRNASPSITIHSGRFHGSIATLPADEWGYPGVDDAAWLAIPNNFLQVLKSLRAFIPDKPAQAWAGCVALEHGYCYATNNIALAGINCDIGAVQALLPSYAIDFLLRRQQGLESWAWCDNYVAFKWQNGAWIRAQLVLGKFPEKAAAMVRKAIEMEPTQAITDDFRSAFADVASLSEDTIRVYADRMEAKFKRSIVQAPCECEVPSNSEYTIWGAGHLAPVIAQATHWAPHMWPKPTPFKGDNLAGFIVGRKEAGV